MGSSEGKDDAYAGVTKVPIRLPGPGAMYATALFQCAMEEDCIGVVDAELSLLQALAKVRPELQSLFSSPVLSNKVKKETLQTLLSGIQVGKDAKETYKLTPLTASFLHLLLENKRLNEFQGVVKEWKKLTKAARKEVDVSVTTANDLAEPEKQQLADEIQKKYFEPESKLQISFKVDPSLIKGYILSSAGVFVDLSRRTELEAFNKTIDNTIATFFDEKRRKYTEAMK